MIFTDLRTLITDESSYEGNLHLGYRNILPESQKLFGIYAALDHKKTKTSSRFNQIVLGMEHCSNAWFVGANVYKPIGKTTSISKKNTSEREEAKSGLDITLGKELTSNLIGYASGYYFHGKEGKTIYGPRLKLTYYCPIEAISTFCEVYEQDPEYVSEVIKLLGESYKKVGWDEKFVDYLDKRITEKPRIYYISAMADYINDNQGEEKAIEYLSQQMPRCLSLRGLKHMLRLYVEHVDVKTKDQLSLLKEFVDRLLENKPVYRCVHCGFSGKNIYWQCPSCRRWNSVKPIHGLEGD